WLGSLATPTTTISSSYAGALPFLVDAVHIDALGLNTPYIARHGTFDPNGPQDSKTDMRWVIEQRPDIIEGYLSGLALLRGAGPDEIVGARRRKMILEMLSSPRFQREYVFVRNAPYDRMDRAAFFRRDFWEAHSRRDTLDCVSVAETTLAVFASQCASPSERPDVSGQVAPTGVLLEALTVTLTQEAVSKPGLACFARRRYLLRRHEALQLLVEVLDDDDLRRRAGRVVSGRLHHQEPPIGGDVVISREASTQGTDHIAALEQLHRRAGRPRRPARDSGAHPGAGGRDPEASPPAARPRRLSAPARRHLPLPASDVWKRPDVNLIRPRIVGIVRKPAPVGRHNPAALAKGRLDERKGLARA